MTATGTAGIIIIGDEILSGMIQDSNSPFMIRELRQAGVEVMKISVIRDSVDAIACEAKEFSERFDHVFTSGGIGPTHDDVTIEGLAKAFNVRVVINEQLRGFLESRFGNELTPPQLRMAEVPEGAAAIEDAAIGLPLIRYRNIFVLPGVPEYLREKFAVIVRLMLNGTPPLLKKVYVAEYETKLAPLLDSIVREHPEVKVGSYPAFGKADYSVMIALESRSSGPLDAALRQLLSGLSAEKVIRIEG